MPLQAAGSLHHGDRLIPGPAEVGSLQIQRFEVCIAQVCMTIGVGQLAVQA